MHRSIESAWAHVTSLFSQDREGAKNESAPWNGLVALADYRAPSMPAESVVRTVWRRIRERLASSDADPVRAENRLQATALKVLDEVAGAPAWGPLLDDFDAEVRTWLQEPAGTFHCVLVLPPCDADDVLGSWAHSRGHAVLRAPRREPGQALSVMAGAIRQAPAHRREGSECDAAPSPQERAALLVIPQLETWFLRRRNGLLAVRALLDELQQSERRCLIGCNSWAWSFLVRAVGAAAVLPGPRAFAAFDARRLQAWLSALARQPHGGPVVFRLANSGADVFAIKGGENHEEGGALQNNYLQELAARSHGIPWVAWSLWRNALRTGIDAAEKHRKNGQQADQGKCAADTHDALSKKNQAQTVEALEKSANHDERTLWIADVADPGLPPHHDDNALLVLHALLIHGALHRQELLGVLPDVTALEVLPALLRAGFIEQRQGRLAVLASAYPAVRRALLADGFPVGEL